MLKKEVGAADVYSPCSSTKWGFPKTAGSCFNTDRQRQVRPWKKADCFTLRKRITSSTAQGGGGSFKNRKPIGEVGCCESGMAERIHWWTERCLRSPLFRSLSLTIYLPTYLSAMYLSIYRSISLSLFHLSSCLPVYLSIYLSIYLSLSLSRCHLSICLAVYLSICLSVYLSTYLSICLPVYLWCSVIQRNVV